VLAYQETRDLLRVIVKEGAMVAQAYGIALPTESVERLVTLLNTLEPAAMGPMAFDLLTGRRLEVEALHGTMVRLGQGYGLSLPFNTTIYVALKPYAQGVSR
jgi:2-dehydropantoate 2-reductase